MNAPLLEMVQARIDDGGAAAIDGLSLRSEGARVLVLGAARALFEATCGMRPIVHGELRVRGAEPPVAVRRGVLAGAPLDAPMPPDWTPRTFATWSARLAGHARRDAQARADDALQRMHLDALADAPLGKAALPLRRATAIAAAIATGAETIVLEDPLAALPGELARHLAQVTVAALADRAWIVFAARVPIASPIALATDEAIVVAGSQISGQGAPGVLAARDRRYALHVHGGSTALAELLEQHGAQVEARAAEAQPRRLLVDLAPGQTTRDLLALAEAAGAVIVELRPLARAFA
jgi:energy-coupling factor transporter ATP-binding protein EcfA2